MLLLFAYANKTISLGISKHKIYDYHDNLLKTTVLLISITMNAKQRIKPTLSVYSALSGNKFLVSYIRHT